MLSQLKNLGLSDKEAKVYLASLEMGSSPAQEIAQKADINRTTAYAATETLIDKGLMSSYTKEGKKFFTAESPERLLSLIRLQEKEAKEKERQLKKILPDLENLEKLTKEKPKVRFFEGVAGIKAIREDILKTKMKTLDEFVNLDAAYKLFPPNPEDHRKKFHNMPQRIIYTSKKGPILPEEEGPIKQRFVSLEKFPFSAEINIYNKKIAIVAYEEQVGLIIENTEIADTLRTIFELSWKGTR